MDLWLTGNSGIDEGFYKHVMCTEYFLSFLFHSSRYLRVCVG